MKATLKLKTMKTILFYLYCPLFFSTQLFSQALLPAGTLESDVAFAAMGFSVASAGDVNGDGYNDVIVGAPFYSDGETNEGAALVYYGTASGLNALPDLTMEGNQANAWMGWSVASAGDVNADGYSDVIVGARNYSNGESSEGAAFVYHGSANGIITSPANMLESNQIGAQMGISVACAGDVNDDGFSDIIIGAHWYDNGEFDEGTAFIYHGSVSGISTIAAATVESNQVIGNMAYSVASAGDVNGDGYSDVVVSTHQYSNGQTSEGAAIVYNGSASGIIITPAAIIESNQAYAFMGRYVASAGDVNGDGYSDIIIGANEYDNPQINEGKVFVYHGSASGIIAAPAASVESDQAYATMGAVSTAGDLNGDGYSDVIVGADRYDNGELDEGRIYIYYGSASGIGTMSVQTIECNQANAYLGVFVAAAGDVNGDGNSDIIVGASNYDNGQTDEGAVFVYHGCPGTIEICGNAIDDNCNGQIDEDCEECQPPTSLSTVKITPTKTQLLWDAVSGAISYKIRYKVSGTSEWTITKSLNNHKTLNTLAANTEYAWQVKSFCEINPVVSSEWSEKQFFTTDDLRLSEGTIHETTFELYPNPVSQSATISFSLNEASPVIIEILDVNGRSLKVIADENFSEGSHEIKFNRESLSAGIYFLQLKTNEGVMMKTVVIE